MPNVTTAIPPHLTGDTATDLVRLREWGTALVDELTYLLSHLDAGNVTEAASVKAENIDTNSAKITNAQIDVLTADKLVAGTVDTDKVTVKSEDGTLTLSGSRIAIQDGERLRFLTALDPRDGTFQFLLCNKEGVPTASLDSNGNAVFTGRVESSQVYGSTIVGTDSISYDQRDGGVFAKLDPMGLTILQDADGDRKQKLGMSVGDDGTAYLVLGAGNGQDSHTINGVVYTNGTFNIEKNDACATLGLVGYPPQISLWEQTGELWLSGRRVLLNGVDILSRLDALEQTIQGGV